MTCTWSHGQKVEEPSNMTSEPSLLTTNSQWQYKHPLAIRHPHLMLPSCFKLKTKPDALISLTSVLLLCSLMMTPPSFHPVTQVRRNLNSLQLLSLHSHFSHQVLSSWPLWTLKSVSLLHPHLLCPRSCSHHHLSHRHLQEAPTNTYTRQSRLVKKRILGPIIFYVSGFYEEVT